MMSHLSHAPSGGLKRLGYALIGIRELLNGFDTGSGYAKLPIWMLGLSVTLAFLFPVFLVGSIFAVIMFARAIYDEKERNRKEEALLKKKLQLALELAEVEGALTIEAKLQYESSQEVFLFLRNQRGTDKRDTRLLLSPKLANQYATNYPPFSQPLIDDQTNDKLLKCLLRNYLTALNMNPLYATHNGPLPSQDSILKMIYKVKGYHSGYPDFLAKMHQFLQADSQLQTQFFFLFYR